MARNMMRLFALTICVLLHSPAWAHDHWINEQRLTDPQTKEWCCNLHDCQEEPDNVKAVEGGFLIISTGEVIPSARVIWKSPGGWWRCRYMHGAEAGKTRCLIGPPLGT